MPSWSEVFTFLILNWGLYRREEFVKQLWRACHFSDVKRNPWKGLKYSVHHNFKISIESEWRHSYCSWTVDATAHLLCLCLVVIFYSTSPAESTVHNRISDLSALHYGTNKRRCLLKFTGSPDEQNAQEGKKSEGRHTVQSNEICYSGPFYTHLITRSNRFCETPSPFEDTPTTHVIWLVFYMRYQPRPIMRADHNVPVIQWGGDSVRRNHNLGQLKTDPWISGSHNAL